MEFRILGPLEVTRDGRALQLGGTRPRAVLAILLLHANEVVSSDSLIDRLWGGRPPLTAAKALQVYVSRLRKAVGSDALKTRPPGYLVHIEPGQLDLHRFEQLVARAQGAAPDTASQLLDQALSLWRGAPLADFAYEAFAQAEIARLDELKLAALEGRIEAELALGRNAQVVGELERLFSEYPLRELLRGQLMLALYRSGRQADALAVYQDGRRLLDEELGLEPSESLQSLQRAILAHDAVLDGATPTQHEPACRSIVVVPRDLEGLGPLLSLAEPLARGEPPRELVVAYVAPPDELSSATGTLRDRRTELVARGLTARVAAFSSPTAADDLVKLASQHDADLLLLEAGASPLDGDPGAVLESASCDVALLLAAGGPLRPGPVVVPFGAAEHDWAALELGAWVARATDATLRLIGAASDQREDGRDASRLLADASLIVQRTANMVAEPLLASPGREGVMALAEGAGLLVVGLSERWRKEGLGKTRARIAAAPPAPTVFVRRGLRPGGMAPVEARTRFRWSMTSAAR